MLKVKNGVTPSNLVIAAAAANVAQEMALVIWITSGTDGAHMEGSRHYAGAALDFRTSNLTKKEVGKFMDKMRERLGPAYDVVLESDHVHVEKDHV
jgi:hypothetical protein